MSNHEGGFMLNEVLHGLVDTGIMRDITADQKKSILALFWHLNWHYDCNWAEIIDTDLAVHLGTCAACGGESEQINSDDGYCHECVEGLRASKGSKGSPLPY